MKHNRLIYAGLILCTLTMLVFPIAAASANDDNSWLTPPTFEQSLEILGALIPYAPAYPTFNMSSDDNSWFTPASQDQIIAWEAENAKKSAESVQPSTPAVSPVATPVPYTITRADLDRLLGNYKSGTAGTGSNPAPVTPVPTASPVTTGTPVYDNRHTIDGTPVSTLFNQAMDRYRANPTVPVTIPATAIVTPLPSPSPSGGNNDQGNGISLAAFSLQGRYVTISNTGSSPVVMTGWKITNSQGNTLTFIDFPLAGGSTFTYVLYPFTTLTVYFGKDGVMSDTSLYYPGGGNFWNAGGDTASLYNAGGQLIGRITA